MDHSGAVHVQRLLRAGDVGDEQVAQLRGKAPAGDQSRHAGQSGSRRMLGQIRHQPRRDAGFGRLGPAGGVLDDSQPIERVFRVSRQSHRHRADVVPRHFRLPSAAAGINGRNRDQWFVR